MAYKEPCEKHLQRLQSKNKILEAVLIFLFFPVENNFYNAQCAGPAHRQTLLQFEIKYIPQTTNSFELFCQLESLSRIQSHLQSFLNVDLVRPLSNFKRAFHHIFSGAALNSMASVLSLWYGLWVQHTVLLGLACKDSLGSDVHVIITLMRLYR